MLFSGSNSVQCLPSVIHSRCIDIPMLWNDCIPIMSTPKRSKTQWF